MHNVTNEATLEVEKTRYLLDRLKYVYGAKQAELRNLFGLNDDEAPRTPRELLERIENKKFVVHEDDMDMTYCGNPILGFNWRDPSVKKDYAGFNVADKELKLQHQSYFDDVKVNGSASGLEILKTFQGWNPSNKKAN